MQINIFEGARRVALLLAVIVFLVTVGLAFNATPYITANFSIEGPGEPLVATSVECDPQSSSQVSFDSTTPKGRSVWIRICLVADQLAMEDGTTQGFIQLPPGPDGKPSWNYNYSPAVQAYEKVIRSTFQLPADEGIKADRDFEAKRFKHWKNVATGLALFLLAFWTIVSAIGWIVRGFMGIPRGKDARPAPGDGK